MQLSDFDFELPEALIAQHPLDRRSASRLLDCTAAPVIDRMIAELPERLRAGDLLIFNDTRVVKARLFGIKDSGGRIELLVERVLTQFEASAQWRASHAPRAGTTIRLGDESEVTVLACSGGLVNLRFVQPVLDVLERSGELPLPPYIRHKPDAVDEMRYQTVFARAAGAVAAPTAGLHFDEELLAALDARGVERLSLTLHVGAGTFSPVRDEDLSKHVMHAEQYDIPASLPGAVRAARTRGSRVVAIGTTSLRALESACDADGVPRAGPGETQLFITPGYRFRVVDILLTNFHLPKSTLLMLVAAFGGIEAMRSAYRHAIAARYRFFSYGDAMLIARQ